MGLFSSSKSKSKKTNITNTQNTGFSEVSGSASAIQGTGNRISADQMGVDGNQSSVIKGSRNQVNYLDGGAIERAFKFAETASGQAAATVSESVAAVNESARAETENVANQIKTAVIYLGMAFAGYKAIQVMSNKS